MFPRRSGAICARLQRRAARREARRLISKGDHLASSGGARSERQANDKSKLRSCHGARTSPDGRRPSGRSHERHATPFELRRGNDPHHRGNNRREQRAAARRGANCRAAERAASLTLAARSRPSQKSALCRTVAQKLTARSRDTIAATEQRGDANGTSGRIHLKGLQAVSDLQSGGQSDWARFSSLAPAVNAGAERSTTWPLQAKTASSTGLPISAASSLAPSAAPGSPRRARYQWDRATSSRMPVRADSAVS